MWIPQTIAYVAALCNVGKGYNVTRVIVVACLVCDPYLDTVDVYTRQNCRQLRHGTVIVVAEIVCEEEVLVLVVVGNLNLICRELGSAF